MTCNFVKEKLDFFLHSKNVPHIIFHGSSGSGKRTIVCNFIHEIYGGDAVKMKKHVMIVNCSHGKGIKFIREDIKFFARHNIQSNYDVMFKSILLLNADSLTIDAQSALRRCIELFSHNTRFFIVVEKKHKLLNPILSRFCEIYIPDTFSIEGDKIVNLHSVQLHLKYPIEDILEKKRQQLRTIIESSVNINIYKDFIDLSVNIYENGYTAKDVMDVWSNYRNAEGICIQMRGLKESQITLFYYKLKNSFRCEKMLIFYILKYCYPIHSNDNGNERLNDAMKNMLLV
jgi:DNA polymerase III delta prime subunit